MHPLEPFRHDYKMMAMELHVGSKSNSRSPRLCCCCERLARPTLALDQGLRPTSTIHWSDRADTRRQRSYDAVAAVLNGGGLHKGRCSSSTATAKGTKTTSWRRPQRGPTSGPWQCILCIWTENSMTYFLVAVWLAGCNMAFVWPLIHWQLAKSLPPGFRHQLQKEDKITGMLLMVSHAWMLVSRICFPNFFQLSQFCCFFSIFAKLNNFWTSFRKGKLGGPRSICVATAAVILLRESFEQNEAVEAYTGPTRPTRPWPWTKVNLENAPKQSRIINLLQKS